MLARNWLLAAMMVFAAGLGGEAADSPKTKAEKIHFTEDEAKFLANLSDQAELITVMKVTLHVVDAADTAWPTSPSDLSEYLVKKTIEVMFDAPKVADAIKNLEGIKRKAAAGEIQLFMDGKSPLVKGGRPSGSNRKYFQSLVNAYLK